MEKEIQKIEPNELTVKDVKQYICPEATEKEVFMFLQIAKSCNLNPFLNQLYLVKYGNQKAQILTSYNVYLQRAERSGKYAGLETRTEGSVKSGDLKAIVKVFRKDWKEPLTHEVYFEEYAQYVKDKNTGKMRLNKFWGTKSRTMITKVAISQAFRLAFPLDFEGIPYIEEEKNFIEVEQEPQKTTVKMPTKKITEGKEEVLEAEINEKPQKAEVSEETEELNVGESGTITKEMAKSLQELSSENGYTREDVYEVIGTLGYKKTVDILNQDYETLLNSFKVNAEDWRINKTQIKKEQQQEWDDS